MGKAVWIDGVERRRAWWSRGGIHLGWRTIPRDRIHEIIADGPVAGRLEPANSGVLALLGLALFGPHGILAAAAGWRYTAPVRTDVHLVDGEALSFIAEWDDVCALGLTLAKTDFGIGRRPTLGWH